MAGDYTSWHVGMKVVCVDDELENCGEIYPKLDEVYTIRSINPDLDGGPVPFIRFEEVRNALQFYAEGFDECEFIASNFRPVLTRKTDISIFTAMLRPIDAKLKETV
jgi:hypothetical protein